MSRKLFEADEEGTMAIRIVTDSACDLPQDVCGELDIEVVPLTIRFGDREYVDRKELSTEAFWKQMETSSVLPETAAPSVGAFEETFRRLADGGADGIACINLSAQLSATMQSAQLAAKALDGECPVEIIDSCSASMGIGNLVLHAARCARDGADLQTVVGAVEERRDRQRVLATLDTLEYLKKGGRIGGARALAASMLSIKPVISVTDGVVQEAGKVRTRRKALQFIVDRIPQGRVEMISVLHAGAPDLDAFLSLVQPMVPDAEVVVGMIGPVVGVHTGPRVIGVAWIERAG
jgi:fatty acid kinase fatty acid binding subunit